MVLVIAEGIIMFKNFIQLLEIENLITKHFIHYIGQETIFRSHKDTAGIEKLELLVLFYQELM